MALLLARAAGPQARVLADTGHHYLSQNIEPARVARGTIRLESDE
jgi:hypothetical protein